MKATMDRIRISRATRAKPAESTGSELVPGSRRGTFQGMDLNLLRVFAALIREGNVTRAGTALCLSQSAVSNSLQRLRSALGDVLFERNASGVRPTSRGLELWQQLQPHYLSIEKVLTPEAFDPMTYDGAFTIAMSDYTVERIMPRLGAYLEVHAPRVQINLMPYSVANMFPMFEREGIDLAIGANRDDAQHSRGLRASTLWSIHSRCLMRRDHPLASGKLTLKRFLSARHLDVCLPGMTMPLYDNVLAAHGIRRNLIITLNHYTQTLAVLAATDYIAVLPVSLLDLSAYASKLCQRDPPIAMPERPLGTIWHQRHESSPPHVWLRQVLNELFAAPKP
jgi:DNA-binding transcriptional LysR family regulator